MTIPAELRDLVFHSVKLFGLAIKDIYGEDLFQKIESLRLKMKSVRKKEAEVVHQAMEEVYTALSKSKNEELHKINQAFSLMLEIINACEAAYRAHRLKEKKIDLTEKPEAIVYVFTSHPTEARSQSFLHLTDRVEDLLGRSLDQGLESVSAELLHLFRISLRIMLANNKRPQVKDEAEQIFHTIMDERILSEQVALKMKGLEVFFRTWVGGDKDGHPKVGPTTLHQTLSLSRRKILWFISKRLKEYEAEIEAFHLSDRSIMRSLDVLKKDLKKIAWIGNGDGKHVLIFRNHLTFLLNSAEKGKLSSPLLHQISELIALYPALVLPMEIREDSSLIHEALQKGGPIADMLALLAKISRGTDPRFYVRGFIISMCQTAEDLMAAVELSKKKLGDFTLPAIPLFENEQGLKNGGAILRTTFKKMNLHKEHQKRWNGRFEVMLGYSDSSKENGVLPSRLLVEKALLEFEEVLVQHNLVPVFFHGSGGSTGRGGGSLKEQIAWWPKSALNIYKMTVQGETIQRHFHQPAIIRSEASKIAEEFALFKSRKLERPKVIENFATYIQTSYRELVKDPSFQEMTTEATPYDFLNLLRIGSRPTKRSGKGQFSLRAIPWILCWTQTRLLLPIWWGTGTAWSKLTTEEKEALRGYYEHSPLMQTYMKNLGFTLARVEYGVWEFHLAHSNLSPDQKKFWNEKIKKEFDLTLDFFHGLTGEENFTWFQPRLGESITFRSSMIHPLNVIQKISLERNDQVLLRETVTGIACGMLTTG